MLTLNDAIDNNATYDNTLICSSILPRHWIFSRPTYFTIYIYIWIIFSFNKPIEYKQHDLSRLLSIKATDQIGAGT